MAILDNSPGTIDTVRPRVQGKFIFVGDEKFYVRGVSYGAFQPDEDGNEYFDNEVINKDFASMAANGINTVRIPHTTPPRSLLDIAQDHGLRVMVGLSAEQYIGYLIDKKKSPNINEIIRAKVNACAGHPAILCYGIGNEIPASIVRWLGHRRVERYIEGLYLTIKSVDPDSLVTYVNYPTTEYLQLPFLDFLCFNVYLESQGPFEAYLARLHNIAGERPLVMSEIGLDSLRNGEDTQANVLEWQIRSTFNAGCAGVVIFSWTDEWYRGGAEVDDWEFGLTTNDRNAKPSLAVVREAYKKVPIESNGNWPSVSVIVCTYNGAERIRDCCEGLTRLDYPNYEIIFVNDGSTDATLEIINEYDIQVINTKNNGLSNARNTGLNAAQGEIIAYLDDDAYPDEHWLTYLTTSFNNSKYSGIGGPNISPPDDGFVSECVTNAPGNPVHVLLSDQEAEHIPGCNMAFRKDDLQKIGGFDPQFRVAGDDVDICWRLQQNGATLGINPAATVWHHRRNSVRSYWKQQVGYGKAESQLMRKWPQKHNSLGHWLWRGRIYGPGLTRALPFRRSQVFHGSWGSAPFQSLYNPGPGTLLSLSLMPEWYFLIATLFGLSLLGIMWKPMMIAAPFLILAVALPIIQAVQSSKEATYSNRNRSTLEKLKIRTLTSYLHIIQPLACLWGRMHNYSFIRRHNHKLNLAIPIVRTSSYWSENWVAPEKRLEIVEESLQSENVVVLRGGDYDRWDLEVRDGMLSSVRTFMAVEDHGSGNQLIRFRSWPRVDPVSLILISLFAILAILAANDQAWITGSILGIVAVFLITRIIWSCSTAMASLLNAIDQGEGEKVS
ncbi:MAG: glycosyltransferase [Chloroflexota bacterium]|nr:MAG: glycosyltransferase [Chloroflexota bacterium]